MNPKSALPLALTAALAFAAGLGFSAIFPSGTPSKGSSSASLGTGGGPTSASTVSKRALPLALDDRRPQSTKELVAGFQDAINEPNYLRRLGRLWWLSDSLTPANAREVTEALLKSSRGMERDFLGAVIFNGWARVDAKAAIAYARKLPPGEQRDQATLGALAGWASNDFEAASHWVDALPSGELKRDAGRTLISTLAETDPDGALELALRKSRTTDGFGFAYSIFPALVRRDPEKAAERASNLPAGRFRTQALRVVANQWSQSDREAALAWIDTIPESGAKQETFSGVLQEWVRSDFDGSLAWLQKRPEGTARNRMIRNLSYIAASDNPENALRLVDLVTSNSGQDDMLQDIARVWSRNDPAAARQWAQSQTDGSVKKVVMNGVISGMSSEYPEQAAALVLQLPQDIQRDAVRNLASNWARQDPVSAANWAGALADGNSRQQAMGNVMSNWVRDDPSAALQWYSHVPASTERDAVVGNFVGSLVENDPKAAVQWAQSIQDQKQRLSRLANVAGNWMRNDSANARAWIANSELSPEAKKQLLSRPAN